MTKNKTIRNLAGVLAVLALLGGSWACSSDDAAEVTVSDLWARTAPEGGNTGIFFTIQGGDVDDQLVGVKVDASIGETAEVHETVAVDDTDMGDDMDDGMGHDGDSGHDGMGDDVGDDMDHGEGMGDESDDDSAPMRMMRQVDAIDIPAGEEVALEPGGYHVMVLNLAGELTVGDEVPITLVFAEAGEIEVTVPVEDP